ncbi:MAG TPA: hypothetical protein VGN07_14705 [Steroidobacteraceae bacterium]
MNKAIFTLSFTTLAFGATTLYFKEELRDERDRFAALQTHETAEPPPTPATTTAQVVAPGEWQQSAAPVTASRPALIPTPSIAPPLAAPVNRMTGNFAMVQLDLSRKLLEDPEYREAMRAQQKIMLLERYPDLGASLHLQPDQQERLIDLLADQQMRAMTNAPPVRTDGQPPDENSMREWNAQMQKQQRDNQAELAALLGDDGLQQWSEYQSTLGARMQVRQLRTVMEAGGEPLRDDQVQSLVTAIANEDQRRNAERVNIQSAALAQPADSTDRTAVFEQMLQRTEQRNKRLHDAVAPYLSSQQLANFDASQSRQLQMQRANLTMIRAQSAANAREGLPANGAATVIGVANGVPVRQ